MGRIIKLALFLVFALILVHTALSLNFATLPNMNNDTKSDENLICSWNSTDAINTTIIWYNSSSLYSNSTYMTSVFNDVLPHVQKRGEIWTCDVIIINSTNSISANYSVTIKNSPPKNFFMYNSSNNFRFDNLTNITEDVVINFYVNATDYDLDALTYSANNKPSGATLNPSSGVFTWTPLQSNVGFNNVTFWVTDNNFPLTQSGLLFSFFVVEVNDVPTFVTPITDKIATENDQFTYTITVSDEESNNPLTLTVNDSLLTVTKLSNTTFNLSFLPDFIDRGNHTIKLNLTDSLNASNISLFNLEVISINHAPYFTYIENTSSSQGQSFFMRINASDIDSQDTLNFSVNSVGCPIQNLWNITVINNSANNSYVFINVTNITNNHVICKNITIIITDRPSSVASYNILLNITNVNDAPIIYENSSYAYNSRNNFNIYNLSTYQYSNFKYKLNFTDIDMLLGDNVAFFTNFTDFNITLKNDSRYSSENIGEINFSTEKNGTYYMFIQARDTNGSTDNKTLIINIYENTRPNITQPLNYTLNESELFSLIINATDVEDLDLLQNWTYSSNDTSFEIDNLTGLISFTPNQSKIGNHSIKITVTDYFGAESTTFFSIEILNKNDAPVLNSFSNFNNTPIVVGNPLSYVFTADDLDLLLNGTQYAYDSLIFWSNESWFNVPASGEIIFTPRESDIGNHSITIGVNDSLGLYNTSILSFRVYNVSTPPVILNITPYGTNLSTYTNFGWADVNEINFPGRFTLINISENTTLSFNHTTINTDDDETISYNWFYNGTLVNTTHDYSRYFDFFSSGIFNVTLLVNDSHFSNSSFTWVVNVSNINRPIEFIKNPDNRTGNQSLTGHTTAENYFDGIFYDPDDDINSNNIIDTNESNTFSIISIPISDIYSDNLNITVSGIDAIFNPLKTGEAVFIFTASDGESNSSTDNVYFNMTVIDSGKTPTPQSSTSKTKTEIVYYQIEIDKVVNLKLLAPKSVVVYKNNTVIIPLKIRNDGNKTLFDIKLSANTDNKEVSHTFDKNSFETLLPSEEKDAFLTLNSYRTQGSYEIEVVASIQNPKFNDSALILIDSLEKQNDESSSSESANTKIAYAMDMLSANPKCLELNEMLDEIKLDIGNGKINEASIKLENVIKTCRYLISEKELIEEKPSIIRFSFDNLKNNPKMFYLVVSLIAFAFLGMCFSIYYTNKKD